MILANDFVSDPRVDKEASALAARGHDVTVLAWDRLGKAPEIESRNGYAVERFGPRAAYGAGWRSLPLYRRFWRAAADRAVELSADAVHCHDSDTAMAGLWAVRDLGTRSHLVVDFHELYRVSSMVPQKGLVGVVARYLVDRLERRAVKRAAVVIVANPGTADYYRGIGAGDRLLVVDNAPDPLLFTPRPCSETTRPFTACFVGRKRYARSLEALMQAIQPYDDMKAVLAGGGPDAERIETRARALERIETIGQVPYERIPDYYACCDAVYGAYDTLVGNVLYTIPGKVIEAMGCAKPVIVSSGTWVGDYVTKNRVGVAVACDDPDAIGQALVYLRDHPEEAKAMGRRGREIVEAGLNWPAVAERLTRAYATLDAKTGG